ncbi:MAG: hypothetical protein ACR2PI_21245, partial [Hyphomicrobiaceae bacterium]
MNVQSFSRFIDDRSWHIWSSLAMRRWLASILLGLVAIVSYLPGQTHLPAIDRTEGMVALSSRYV